MFANLSEKLQNAFHKLTSTQLTHENTQETIRTIRLALLEADVALPVCKEIVDKFSAMVIGSTVPKEVKPAEYCLTLMQDLLTNIMGNENTFVCPQKSIILLFGIQGSGKTTTAGKLAKWLQTEQQHKVCLASIDTHRPAAIEQLSILAQEIGAESFVSNNTDAKQRCLEVLAFFSKNPANVLIIDTAGRGSVQNELMDELTEIHHLVQAHHNILVFDSQLGRDAFSVCQEFQQHAPLTGLIATKVDSDARGGAILTAKHVTGLPILFVGNGEKLQAFEKFHPDRMASRILGMGDLSSLVEQLTKHRDSKKDKQLANKLQTGIGFNFEDMLEEFSQLEKMGGFASILGKLPGTQGLKDLIAEKAPETTIKKNIAIIRSMTPKERKNPLLVQMPSRKMRITKGSGTTMLDLNRLLKQHKMMKEMGKGKMQKKMQQVMQQGGMSGGLGGPPPWGMFKH